MTGRAITGPAALIDGPSCVLLARYLRVLVPALEAAGRLEPIRPALDAIAEAAAAQRAQDRQAFDAAATSEWITVAEAAALAGCSPQAIRARLGRGTLAGDRRAAGWRVDPAQLVLRPAQRRA
jgi:hypothetical protein